VQNGRSITIYTFDDGSLSPFFPLDPRVKHIPLNIAGHSSGNFRAICVNIRRIRVLRQEIRAIRPRVVISFMDKINILAIFAMLRSGIPVIAAERSHPRLYRIGPVWSFLRRIAYPMAYRIVVQTDGAKRCFPLWLRRKIAVIPNPVQRPDETVGMPRIPGKFFVAAMGRMTEEKRFDLLLRAFARVYEEFPAWNLKIAGDGPLRKDLERLRNFLNLGTRVEWVGIVNNSHKFLKGCDIFVLTSRFEGFPNALCEAMACGLAVIAVDCPNGPREIVRHDVDGILVPLHDMDALVAAMKRLMSDENERRRLGAEAKRIVERFSVERIMRMWDAIYN
jgi:glycosyltransferase involved in cell wall biosynthesis